VNTSPSQKRKAARGRDGFANEEVTDEISHAAPSGTSGNGQREHRGYFRVSEEAIRRIHRSFDKPCVTRAALLAYQALCRVANLRGSSTFVATIRSLAQDMAYEYREGQRALGYVESIRLVHIKRTKVAGTKENAPSTYSLVTLLPDATTSKHEATTSWGDDVRGTSPQLTQEQIQSIHTKNI